MAQNTGETRERGIFKTSIIGIITNVFLGLVKALVGILAGSIALATDALNNLSDAVSSIITIVGTKLAGKRPTKDHPYGYGRIEYMTALIIGLIVLAAGLGAAKGAIDGILHPEEVNYSISFIAIVLITMVVKVILGKYTVSQGEKLNSEALKAAGIDAKNDALVSAVTLLAAAIYFITDINVDAYAGGLISLAVIKAGFDILKETISTILGERIDSKLSTAIYDKVKSYQEVIGAHDLILNNYGPNRYVGSIHIEVDGDKTFDDLYPSIYRMEREIHRDFSVLLTIGFYSINKKSPETQEIHNLLVKYVAAYDEIVGFHGICVFEDKKEIFFDVTFTFSSKVKDLMTRIENDVKERYPDYKVLGTIDYDVADGEYWFSL